MTRTVGENPPPDPILHIHDVSVCYGPVQALREISLDVYAGEVVALLGANGAGKSTTLRAASGLAKLSGGHIHFDGRDVSRLSTQEIVAGGLAHAPEGRHVFAELSVQENLDLGAYVVKDRAAHRNNLEKAFEYFPILWDRRRQKAGSLSGGQQQMLTVARALMSSPRLLMLDEPSLGLAPKLVDQIFDIIRQINREDRVTILLVEQNANEALLHADRAYVLETGRNSLSGAAHELRRDPRIIEAYLGV
jgi:branched-chain amino acid transport system ATP-binding protein